MTSHSGRFSSYLSLLRVSKPERHDASARALLSLIREKYGFQASELSHSPDGRPFVRGFPGDVSVSHSGILAAVLASPGPSPVGVDIQITGGRYHYREIAHRFFTQDEARWIGEKETPLRFTALWTGKEALMKATGKPLIDILKSDCLLERSDFSLFQVIADGKTYLGAVAGCSPLFTSQDLKASPLPEALEGLSAPWLGTLRI